MFINIETKKEVNGVIGYLIEMYNVSDDKFYQNMNDEEIKKYGNFIGSVFEEEVKNKIN